MQLHSIRLEIDLIMTCIIDGAPYSTYKDKLQFLLEVTEQNSQRLQEALQEGLPATPEGAHS